jgi:hypothetical protein
MGPGFTVPFTFGQIQASMNAFYILIVHNKNVKCSNSPLLFCAKAINCPREMRTRCQWEDEENREGRLSLNTVEITIMCLKNWELLGELWPPTEGRRQSQCFQVMDKCTKSCIHQKTKQMSKELIETWKCKCERGQKEYI